MAVEATQTKGREFKRWNWLVRGVARRLYYLLGLASWVVPRKRGRWIFVSFHFNGQFAGNVSALYEYVQRNKHVLPEGRSALFITSTLATEEHVRGLGLEVLRSRPMWLLPILRADVIFTDAAPHFLGLGRFRVVQLWHGTGYKNILLGKTNSKDSALERVLHKRLFANTELICSTSEEDATRKAAAFNSTNVRVTGSPRNDMLFRVEPQGTSTRRQILYAPTFRSKGGQRPFDDEAWRLLDRFAVATEVTVLIKRHPNDYQLRVPSGLTNVRDVTGEVEDIQDLLARSDILITDYSGLASDFVITGRPIIFYTYDFEEYLSKNRTFYYDLKDLLPGPFVKSPAELLAVLKDLTWFDEPEYVKKYERFKSRMHRYTDGDSSRRFLHEIIELGL